MTDLDMKGLEAAAKVIAADVLGYKWDGLQSASIAKKGFAPIIYSQHGGLKFQGGHADLATYAASIIRAYLAATPTNGDDLVRFTTLSGGYMAGPGGAEVLDRSSGAWIKYDEAAARILALTAELADAERTRSLMARDWFNFCESMGVTPDNQEAVACELKAQNATLREALREAVQIMELFQQCYETFGERLPDGWDHRNMRGMPFAIASALSTLSEQETP